MSVLRSRRELAGDTFLSDPRSKFKLESESSKLFFIQKLYLSLVIRMHFMRSQLKFCQQFQAGTRPTSSSASNLSARSSPRSTTLPRRPRSSRSSRPSRSTASPWTPRPSRLSVASTPLSWPKSLTSFIKHIVMIKSCLTFCVG